MTDPAPAAPLPAAMQELRPLLAAAVESFAPRTPEPSALLCAREGLTIVVEQREEQINELPRTAGTVISAYDGTLLTEESFPGFRPDRLAQAVAAIKTRLPESARSAPSAGNGFVRRDFSTAGRLPVDGMTLEDKLDRCRELHARLAGADERMVNSRVSYTEHVESSVFRDNHSDLAQRVVRVRLAVLVVLSDGGEARYDWQSKGGTGGWELLEYSDQELQEIVAGAARLFSAERIEPGEYTLLTGPGVSGVLAHESFGHGVETDLFPKERARAFDYIGRPVASTLVNIIDDPSLPGGYAGYFFDDEGMLARPAAIVEHGIFQGGITDRASAGVLGIARTANGRRQDYTRKPYARMSNTYIGPGQTPLADMLAGIDHGVFLDRWINGMEDPQGWGIQITCHYGREIRSGKLTDRVFAPVSISGYVPSVLQTVRAAGPDVEMDQGTCGKGHKEYVTNSAGGPHLMLEARLG